MAKMRIHELAKELDKSNKEILNILKEKNVEVKSHMSTVDDDQIKMVKNHYTKPIVQETKEEKPTEAPKKRNISQVFRPQNSKNSNWKNKGNQQGNQRPQNNRNQGPNDKGQEKPRGDIRSQQVRTSDQGQRPNNRMAERKQEQGNMNRNNNNQQNNQQRPHQNNNQNRNRNQSQNHNDQQRRNQKVNQTNGAVNKQQGMQQNISIPAAEKPAKSNFDRSRTSGRNGNGYDRQNSNNREDDKFGKKQNQGDNRSNQGGNRPSQGGNRPNQGGNRPNQGGNRPNQGGNRPNQKKNRGRNRQQQTPVQPPQKKEEVIKSIILPEKMTIKELADRMKVQPSVLIKKLFLQGIMVTVNHEIEYEQAEELALEFNCIAELEEKVDVIEELLKEEEESEKDMVSRPPVVCVMGHVDHGKTSLLDAIRNTHVIDREAGGITQHIGAYMVRINDQDITFLDTPGHEAFTAMRMRGASSTDVAILVVAADDGVMPQTVEAIDHAKAAGIEIIVAVNKMDKPSANIDRVKQELAEHELIPEDWGGSTIFVPVSAKTQEGIEQLLEMILLTAEILELKANPKRTARGLVIEAELDKGKGTVATVLVQKGTLRVGDNIAAGSSYGKVRAMMDDKGRRVKTAGPSMPVEILGLNDVPNAGEIFVSCENDKEARNFAETFISQGREKLLEDTKAKMSLDDLFTQIQAGNLKELGLIVKADVQGSVEAVKQSLTKLSNEEVVVKIIHGGVGAINESDVSLASASNAIIIGFNVRPDATAKEVADREKVDIRLYKVIYSAIEDIEAAMKGMLDPVYEEKVLGHAEVRQTFKASGIGTIAGGYVLDGVFQRGCSMRLTRDGELIYEGPLSSLKRFKDDVKEVKAGYECGLVLENFNDIKEGDMAEAYTMVEVPR